MGDKTKRDDEVTRRGPVKEVVKWFDRNTTLGGWTPAFHSDNNLSRAMWTVLLILGLALTAYSICMAFLRFFQYNIVTSTDIVYMKSGIDLPAVTICNSNRVHCRNLYNVIRDNEMVVPSIGPCPNQFFG